MTSFIGRFSLYEIHLAPNLPINSFLNPEDVGTPKFEQDKLLLQQLINKNEPSEGTLSSSTSDDNPQVLIQILFIAIDRLKRVDKNT